MSCIVGTVMKTSSFVSFWRSVAHAAGECLPGSRSAHARRATFVLSLLSLVPSLSPPTEVSQVDQSLSCSVQATTTTTTRPGPHAAQSMWDPLRVLLRADDADGCKRRAVALSRIANFLCHCHTLSDTSDNAKKRDWMHRHKITT